VHNHHHGEDIEKNKNEDELGLLAIARNRTPNTTVMLLLLMRTPRKKCVRSFFRADRSMTSQISKGRLARPCRMKQIHDEKQ